jgi:formyl-CoA transferase
MGVGKDNAAKRSGPLTDIRVIELGQLIAGPFCGQLLADMGADVIKVEPPGTGDPMRVWGRGDYPLWWTVCARNKRCVTANLRVEEGQEIVKKLVAHADMLLENFRPGTMEKWGLGYDVLSKINPGLIMIRVSGYGQTGPYSSRAGYAAIGEAMGGMRYLAGWPDKPPKKTGQGQVVDSAIYEAVLNVMESTIPEYVVSGYTRERTGSALPNVAPSNLYECADGSFLIAANQDTVFRRLCEAMEKPELADDSRYSTHTARGERQQELDALIEEWTKTKTMEELDELMLEHAVPAGRIYRAREMLDDPQFIAREAIVDVPHERWDNLKMQNIFPKLSVTPCRISWPGPEELGQHNAEVYGELLDMSDEEMSALAEKGVL